MRTPRGALRPRPTDKEEGKTHGTQASYSRPGADRARRSPGGLGALRQSEPGAAQREHADRRHRAYRPALRLQAGRRAARLRGRDGAGGRRSPRARAGARPPAAREARGGTCRRRGGHGQHARHAGRAGGHQDRALSGRRRPLDGAPGQPVPHQGGERPERPGHLGHLGLERRALRPRPQPGVRGGRPRADARSLPSPKTAGPTSRSPWGTRRATSSRP